MADELELGTLEEAGGTGISARILQAVMQTEGLTAVQISQKTGWKAAELRRKVRTNMFRLKEMEEILDCLGYELVPWNRKHGLIPGMRHPGKGPRIRQMVRGVTYDTAASNALANDFNPGASIYTDGVATELYIAGNGTYFFARYYEDAQYPNTIEPIPPELAQKFILLHDGDLSVLPEREGS